MELEKQDRTSQTGLIDQSLVDFLGTFLILALEKLYQSVEFYTHTHTRANFKIPSSPFHFVQVQIMLIL